MFRKEFNCCKSYPCEHMGIVDTQSSLIETSYLGYKSIHCKLCGGFPPLVDNATVDLLVQEKLNVHFKKKIVDCVNCSKYFFFDEPNETLKYGYTSAGNQRLMCCNCNKVFTANQFFSNDKLERLLVEISTNEPSTEIMRKLELPPKTFYEYVICLSSLLRAANRLDEIKYLPTKYLAIKTNSEIVQLPHAKHLYLLGTSEAHSGYVLLIDHNFSTKDIPEVGLYRDQTSTVLPVPEVDSIVSALNIRYQSTMKRHHFESLYIGKPKQLRGAVMVQPSLLAYAHCQILQAFTNRCDHYNHYIEHESSLRAAALMGSSDDVNKNKADLFFVYFHKKGGKDLLDTGTKIGWWNDKWYGTEFGGYSPVSRRKNYLYPFDLKKSGKQEEFFTYLARAMPDNIKSSKCVDALFEIHRSIYNYSKKSKDGTTPAMRLGITKKPLTLTELYSYAKDVSKNYYKT